MSISLLRLKLNYMILRVRSFSSYLTENTVYFHTMLHREVKDVIVKMIWNISIHRDSTMQYNVMADDKYSNH
jgi:hypothetical protein